MYPKSLKYLPRAIVLVSLALSSLFYFKSKAISFHSPQSLVDPTRISEVHGLENKCPPSENVENSSFPYHFTIRNQADADKLKQCYTILGVLEIDGTNASSPIIVDGPTKVIGKVIMGPMRGHRSFNSLTMKTLVYVDGAIKFTQLDFIRNDMVSYVSMLNFPALTVVMDGFSVDYLSNLQTINLPALQDVGQLRMSDLPALHTLNAPRIHSAKQIYMRALLSLKRLHFNSGLTGTIEYLNIQITALTHIENLLFDTILSLSIGGNHKLTSLTFPYLKNVTRLDVAQNNKSLVLDMPELRQVTDYMVVSHLSGIKIPLLQSIGELDVGTPTVNERESDDGWCEQCFSNYLAVFDAPMLTHIRRDMTFDASPGLVNISLPVLTAVKNIEIKNTGVVGMPGRIEVPRLQRAENVYILGSAAHCDVFDDLKRRGVIMGDYNCRIDERKTKYSYTPL